jgi:hypothetical protein
MQALDACREVGQGRLDKMDNHQLKSIILGGASLHVHCHPCGHSSVWSCEPINTETAVFITTAFPLSRCPKSSCRDQRKL